MPETAKTAGKKSVKSAASGVVATVALSFSLTGGANAQAPPAINQLPTGGTVVRGTATIQQTATAQAAAMVVNQTSQRAVVNWNTFNLGSAASVNFVQPNAQAVTLNRVNDSNPSQIFGRITSNGQVFITNANGVYFSPTSSVDVGAITATTHSISDDNFMSGNYVFERKGAVGKVVNEGRISAALGGYVALLAPEVQNAGVVVARAGTVAMAAGEMITLKLEGTGSLAGITATPSAIASLIENKQAVQAPDGLIILSAMALNKLQAGVIKNSGSLEANSLVSKGGKIYLEGDDITLASTSKLEAKGATGGGTVLVGGDWQGSGDLRQATKVTMEAGATIDASATDKGDGGKVVVWSDVHNADSVTAVHGSIKAEAGPNGGDGGKVETSGHVLNVDGIGISARSTTGKNGDWLLDPYNVYIMKDATTSGETLSAGTYTPSSASSYIKSSDLNAALGSANVTVTTGGASPGNSTGNIYVYDGVAWSANKLTLNAWNNIYIYYAMNASGTASLALQYGQGTTFGTGSAYYIDAPVNLPVGANFSTQLGSTGAVKNYTVITSLGLKADATAAPATLTLQGMAASSMTGNYVLGANIDATDTQNWGTTNSFQYFTSIGTTTAFSGTFDGLGHQITNLKVKYTGTSSAFGVGLFGSIAGPSVQLRNVALLNESISGNYYAGGLYGKDNNQTITIDNIYTSGNISDTGGYVGGIGGSLSSGTATNVSSSANVITSALVGGSNYAVAGLFGYAQANIKYSAYYGVVTANNSTYAGAIYGDGRAGQNLLTSVYYDSTKNSGLSGAGTALGTLTTPATGISTSNLTVQSNFSALDFTNVWAMGPSYPLPQFMLGNIVRVLPSSTSIVYGNTPTATLSYVGLQNGDVVATAFTTLPTAAAPANTNVGSQTFYGSGGVAPNYSLVYDPGTVTITKKPLTVSGLSVATSKVYNGNTTAIVSGTASFLATETKGSGTDTDGQPFTGDSVTISGTAVATYNSKDVGTATTISYSGTGLTLSGAQAGNYSISYPTSVSGSITPKGLTVYSPTGLTLALSKTYDGTNTAAVTGTLTSGTFASESVGVGTTTDGKYYTGDVVSIVTGGTPTATYGQSNVGANLNITYTYTGGITGTNASNYTLNTSVASSTGAITKATLSLSGSQVYNGTTTFLGSNLIATGAAGQTFSLTGNNATLASANVTLSPLTQSFTGLVLGSSSNGGLSTNYNSIVATSNVNVSITPATAKLSGIKVYDGATGLTGTQLTITGLTVSGTTQTLSYSGIANLFDTNVATANNYVIGTGLTLTNGTGLASNYILPTFSYSANNSATVNAKPITISLTSPPSAYTYDGSTTYSSIASGIPAVANTPLVGSDSIGSINNTVSSTGIAQAGNFTITPSGVSLSTGTAANYSFTYTPLTVAVAKAALTVNKTTVANKVYDRTNTATLSGGSLVGVFSGDTVTLTEAGTFASVNVGTGIAVTANDTLGGSSANNYTLTQPTSLSADITPKALTVNNTNVASKTYNGSNTATLSGGSLVGVILGDTVTLTQAGTFASANAGTGITVTASDSLGGSSASNYTVTQPTSLSADINKAHLTVTASNASKTYGDANPALSATVSGFVNNETLGTSGVTGTGAATTAATATTGAGTAVISAGAGTLTATNYDFTNLVNGTLTINKADAIVTASSANVTYNGLAQTVSGFTASGLVNGETASVLSGVSASVSGTNAGSYTNSASGTDANYNLTFVTGALNINKAHLSLAANNASKTYGDANPTLSTTLTGFVNGQTLANSGVTGAGTATTTATAATGAGSATITAGIGNLAAANYDFTSLVDGTLTINKAHLTVTASNASKTYGDANPALSATVSGFVNNETLGTSGVTGTGAATTAATATTGAGTAVISAGSGSLTAANYDFTNLVNGSLTINKAHLTVTANNASKTYGDANPTLSATVSGFVNNETLATSGVTGSGSATTTATATTGAGSATISAATGNLAASNYDFTSFVDGTLTINKANATVTASSANVTYTGLAQSVSGFTASGLVNGETASVLSGVSASVSGTNAGTYTNSASGTDANYNLTFVNGALNINKAHLTVTANNASKTYGDANPALSATVSGFVNNETLGTSGVTGTGAATTTATTGAGTAVISAGTGTLTAANYDFTNLVNGTLTINKANATVTASSGSTTYNGAAQSISGFTATGLVNGETTAVLSGVTAGVTGTNAGTYTSTASGADSNYNLSFTNGTYTINKAPLSVSLTGQTKVYDSTTSATLTNGSLTLTGFMSGEGATVSQTQASYNSAHVLNANTVTASLAAGNYTASNGTLLSNYVLPTTASGMGSITPARLSATGTKTYDGLVAFDATGLTVSGVNGETFAATGSGTMGSKNVQTNQALSSIAGLSLSGNNGALSSNYVALTTSDTQVSVTPLAVNLSAPAASKTYDSTTLYQASAADLTTLSSQLVGTDRVTAAEVVYANKDAGTGKRVSLNSVTINDDNGGNNYTVGKLDVTTGVINKAPLTVSVVSDARFVTQSDTAGYAGVVYNGFVGGETASVVTAGSITRSNSGVNGAGQYTGVLQASGWQSGNYNISYNAGDYTIVGAHTLLVSVPTASTTYGTAATYVPTAQYLDSSNNHIVTLAPTMTGNALSVSDGAGGAASFAITAADATLSSSGNVEAGGYNLQASNVVKTGSNFQNLVMTGGLTVTPKVLSNNLGVQPITKVYDGSASISNLGLNFNQTLAGVTSGDTVSLVGSGSFDDRHVATNKTVNLSLGLLGTDAANYALATPSFSTNTGSITQLASVTYTGATNGNWADFSNWAGGAMPDRNNVAQVVVPTGKTVVYSSDQVGTIGSTLAVDGAIRFTSSNAFTLANTVSGAGDLQQRGNGMLTLSGTNTNFTGNLDIGTYQATLNNTQALGTGHVVSSGGQLSVASGVTLNALHVDGAVTVDTTIKTTGDQVYNGALTFLSSGTAQAPNFASDAGNVDFLSTVSAGSGAMTAQRSLAVSALQGRVLFNDQVGRLVKNLDFNTYLTTSLLDTSPYALTVTAPTIKLLGDVTTFDSQTYDGAVLVGNNTLNGNTRLLVSVDPSITFKGTVDDVAPAGKVNGLDVRAISLAALTANMPVPTITFEDNVGSASPLASLRLAAGTQSTASGAVVTDIKTDDTSRRDASYKGDIVLKGNVTVDTAPEMIAEQLLVPNGSPTLTWYTGTPDFRLRLPVSGSSTPPSNLQLVQWGQNNGGGSSSNSGNTSTSSSTNSTDTSEAGRQWLMAHDTHEHTAQLRANEAAIKTMDTPSGRMVADVQVGNEASTMSTMARGNSSRVEAQTVNVISSGAFLQVREFAPQTLQAQQAFVYQLPADTFVHSRENEYIKLSATLSNGANLPRWVKFSVKDRSFSGEAPKHVKSLDVKVTATDRQGKRATTRIRLVFVNGSNS